MLSDTIRQLARAHAMVPLGALAYRGRRGTLTLDLELRPIPAGYGATLTLSPDDPHEDLFATARPIWLLEPEALLMTGDRTFDESIALRAPPELLGLFDHVHRRAFSLVIGKGDARIDAGRLIASLDRLTPQKTQLLVALGHRLCLGRAAAASCLRLIARSDPHPAVRERAAALVSRPGTPADDTIAMPSAAELRARIGDPGLDGVVRIAAFARLMRELPWDEVAQLIVRVRDALLTLRPHEAGPAEQAKADLGLDWLLTELEPRFSDDDLDRGAGAMLLASIWGGRKDLPEALALRLAHLCERVARPELQPCILALVGHPSREVRLAALSALDALAFDPETLLGLLAPEHHLSVIELSPELAESSGRGGALLQAAFRVSFRFNLPGEKRLRLITSMMHVTGLAEDFLWDRLEAPDNPTREAAIEVLGARGTAASLARLVPLTTGLFRSGDLKARARAAIARIVDRHGPLEVGGLALSPQKVGGLALDADR